MKVRWTEDSVRLRITPTELRCLLSGNPVGETLTLPGGVWSAAIDPIDVPSTRLDASSGIVRLILSRSDRDRLAAPESEGVYWTPAEVGTAGIRVIVEKDFPCVHPRAIESREPQTEAFAPPADFEERKRT